jgi:hypothetical protein
MPQPSISGAAVGLQPGSSTSDAAMPADLRNTKESEKIDGLKCGIAVGSNVTAGSFV